MPLSNIQTATGRRNLIINGDMSIWQRGTSTTTLTSNDSTGYNGADRFGQFFDINDGTGTISLAISQSTDTPANQPFDYSLKAVVTDTSFTASGSDNVAPFTYKVETYDANPLGWGTTAAKPATLSYWIKSSVAGTGTLQIRLTDSSSVSSAADGNFFTKFVINTADTWEYKTHVIPANTTDGWRRTVSSTGLHIHWNFGSNQSDVGTEDAWFRENNHMKPHSDQTLNFLDGGGTAYLTGVQLEVGSEASEFEFRSRGEQMAACQRYFTQWTGDANATVATGVVISGTTSFVNLQLPTEMRTGPSITQSSTYVYEPQSSTVSGVGTIYNIGQSVGVNLTHASGLTSGAAAVWLLNTDAGYVRADAEL